MRIAILISEALPGFRRPGRRLHHAAVAAPNVLLDDVFERIARDLGHLDQALLAARHVGDDDGGTTRRALGIERSEDLELHDDPSPVLGRSPPQLRRRDRQSEARRACPRIPYSTFST